VPWRFGALVRAPGIARGGRLDGIAIAERYRLAPVGVPPSDTLATAAGGIPKTLALMNAEAQKLRAYDTHAGTPSGLDAPGQTSSAYDLALIARAAMALPDFRSYVAIVHSAVSAPAGKTIDIYTHDRLLTNYPGAIGIKNGYTVAAQATFVGAATRNGHTLVVTLMHAAPSVWKEAERLLDWGFAAIGHVQPVGQLVDPQPDRTRATAALHAAPVRTSAAAQSGGGLGALPIGLGVSAVVLLIGSWLRRSATRRRRRYSLPPL
jgi:D-alanyl-D-alanine carboxypeptidase (penicillin-binding protein 5/6)